MTLPPSGWGRTPRAWASCSTSHNPRPPSAFGSGSTRPQQPGAGVAHRGELPGPADLPDKRRKPVVGQRLAGCDRGLPAIRVAGRGP
jgi:hypothetical protein